MHNWVYMYPCSSVQSIRANWQWAKATPLTSMVGPIDLVGEGKARDALATCSVRSSMTVTTCRQQSNYSATNNGQVQLAIEIYKWWWWWWWWLALGLLLHFDLYDHHLYGDELINLLASGHYDDCWQCHCCGLIACC